MDEFLVKNLSFVKPQRSIYMQIALTLLVMLLIFTLVTFKATAEVAVFTPQESQSTHTEDTATQISDDVFLHEHIWGNFTGTIADGAQIDGLYFTLGWTVATTNVPLSNTNEPLHNPYVGATESAVTQESNEAVGSVEILEDSQATVETETPSLIETEMLLEDTAPDTDLLPVVTNDMAMQFLNAEIIEVISGSETEPQIVIEDTVEVISDPNLSDETELVEESEHTLTPVENVNQRMVPQVRYSTDNLNWHILAELDLSSSGQTSFDLSHIGIEDLPHLQIAVTHWSQVSESVVTFTTAHMEVSYTELLIEDLFALNEVVDDQKPNFSISAIKADVASQNIRAVVIEKGGILEFWYAVTDYNSQDTTWNRIAGGSTIDGSAPIAIKERTIFWVDANQQTLFGYAVDTQSLFGIPFENDEDKIFTLPFENKNGVFWKAVYDPHYNSLEFNKLSDR